MESDKGQWHPDSSFFFSVIITSITLASLGFGACGAFESYAVADSVLPVVQVKNPPERIKDENGNEIEVRGDVTILHLPDPGSFELAKQFAKKEFANFEKKYPDHKQSAQIVILIPTDKVQDPKIYAGNEAATEMANALGWGNTRWNEKLSQGSLSEEPENEQKRWIKPLQAVEDVVKDTTLPVFVGLVPETSDHSGKAFAILRSALLIPATMLRLGKNTAVYPDTNLMKALPVSVISGSISGWLQLHHIGYTKWQSGKGWIHPTTDEQPSLFEKTAKLYLFPTAYYAVIEGFKQLFGIYRFSPLRWTKDSAKGGWVSMIYEMPAWYGNSLFTQQILRRYPEHREQLTLQSKLWGLLISCITTAAIVGGESTMARVSLIGTGVTGGLVMLATSNFMPEKFKAKMYDYAWKGNTALVQKIVEPIQAFFGNLKHFTKKDVPSSKSDAPPIHVLPVSTTMP